MVQPVPQAEKVLGGQTANDARSVHLMVFDETPSKKDNQNQPPGLGALFTLISFVRGFQTLKPWVVLFLPVVLLSRWGGSLPWEAPARLLQGCRLRSGTRRAVETTPVWMNLGVRELCQPRPCSDSPRASEWHRDAGILPSGPGPSPPPARKDRGWGQRANPAPHGRGFSASL